MSIKVGFNDLIGSVQNKSRTAEPRLEGRGVERSFDQVLRDLERPTWSVPNRSTHRSKRMEFSFQNTQLHG